MGFLHSLEERCSTRSTHWSWGTGYFNDDYRSKWDLNFLRIDEHPKPAEVSAVIAEAETIFERDGFSHRKIHYDDESAEVLVPAFTKLGWDAETLEVMALGGPPPARRDDVSVEEVGPEEIRPPAEEWYRQTLVITDEIAVELADSVKPLEEALDVRYFAVRSARGRIVSWCHLYMGDGVAQIEEVSTFDRYRKRGYANATVTRAVAEAVAAGAGLIFLIADANDWPKEMYARLGFGPVGGIYEYSRLPTS